MKKIILNNHRITIREAVDDVGISFGSWLIPAIFMDVLGMKRVKIVTKLLNFQQKQHRMDIAQEMLRTFNERRSRVAQKARNW